MQLLSLSTDALGPPGSGAETYLGLMRTNAATLAAGLQEESTDFTDDTDEEETGK